MNEQKVFPGQPKVWWSISNKKSPIFGWLVTGCPPARTYLQYCTSYPDPAQSRVFLKLRERILLIMGTPI